MSNVQAYVYDITMGMARGMSQQMVGKQVDIVPHTGIVVFGKEYFFGSGPCIGEPGKSIPCQVHQILELGTTTKTMQELEAHINAVLASEHTPEKYNLLTHNCNHYADDVAKFLLDGKGVPAEIVNIAEEALSTPQGVQMRAMIEQMEGSMRQQSGGQSFNPYGGVGGPQPGAAAAAPVVPAAVPAAAPATVLSDNEELEAALKEINAVADVETKRSCLNTLFKITENVEKNPGEVKFRRIKMSNPAFTKKIQTCAGGVDAMVAAGWLPDVTPEGEDTWQMGDDAANEQATPRTRFAAELAKLPAPPPKAAPAPVPQPMQQPGFGQPGMGGMGGGFPPMGGMPGGMGGMPGGMPPNMPPGMANSPMMQQMMQNPQMMQNMQAQMQNNPQMAQQVQQMMQNPQAMQQMQQMMNDPQMMAQMQNMMGPGGRGGGGGY